jgi:uncharacterized membrane protein (UPF0127 family)
MPARGEPFLRLLHPASGRVLAARLERPRTFVGRGLGLMFRRTLPAGTGMWIAPCNGIHTFFMRFPIDVVFMDRRQRVVRVRPALRSWRMVPLVLRAHSVVELPAGTLEGVPLPPGEQLAVEHAPKGISSPRPREEVGGGP